MPSGADLIRRSPSREFAGIEESAPTDLKSQPIIGSMISQHGFHGTRSSPHVIFPVAQSEA